MNILNLKPFDLYLEDRQQLKAEEGLYRLFRHRTRFGNKDHVPVLLERGTLILTPEQAEAVGLTADAKRMRREQGCECETCKPDPKDYEE